MLLISLVLGTPIILIILGVALGIVVGMVTMPNPVRIASIVAAVVMIVVGILMLL